MKRAFLDKLLARLRRIQPEEVEAFFSELARDKRFLETIFNAIREGVIVTDVAGPLIFELSTLMPSKVLENTELPSTASVPPIA